MPRSSMAALITRARTLIADPAGTSQTFTDDEVQDALDKRRIEQRHIALVPSPTFAPGGAVSFNDFYAGVEYWEDDVVLQDVTYTSITADISEPIVGHWHFNSQPAGYGVRATGKTYDLYGSCADLLDAWAAKTALDFDFVSGRDQYMRSQKAKALMDLAARYRSQALAQTTVVVQSEVAPDFGNTPAVTYPTYVDDFGW